MARPIIVGNVVKQIQLYCGQGGSDKEYLVTVTASPEGARVYTEYGPRGRISQGKEETAKSGAIPEWKAIPMADQIAKDKVSKRGYEIVSTLQPKQPDVPVQAPKKSRPTPAPKAEEAAAPKVLFNDLPESVRAKARILF